MCRLCPLIWGEFCLSIACSSKWLDKGHDRLGYFKKNQLLLSLGEEELSPD